MNKDPPLTCMKEGGGHRGVTDLVDDVCMEKRGRCWRPQEIPMYHVAESCSECFRDNYGWKDKEDRGVWNGRTKTRFQKRKSYDGCDVQLVKKKLEGQENMALGFIDLEKTYDTVPRDGHVEVDGCPRVEVRMVEGPCEDRIGRVVCRPGISEEFRVDVGLSHGVS